MEFDGEAFVKRFNTVWNGHDVDGILAMMTDDVIFEASFGKDPWGARAVGTPAVREFLEDMFRRIPDVRWDEIRHFACPELATVEWLTTGTPRGGTRYEVQGLRHPRAPQWEDRGQALVPQGAALAARRSGEARRRSTYIGRDETIAA